MTFQKSIIEACPNMFMCECGNVIELVPGKVDRTLKDDKGQKLSKQAAEHMANHRIRCNQCEQNFCTLCKCQPYHLGKTCDQLKNASCRFCLEDLKVMSKKHGPAFTKVCKKKDCQKQVMKCCDKILKCGHSCGGIRDEEQCLICLEPECIAKMDETNKPSINKDDYCAICYSTGMGQSPCVQLDCGHIVHHECVLKQVNQGWNGARIVFNYLDCSQCKKELSCKNSKELETALKPQLKFKQIVEDKALKRAEYDNL